VSGVALLVVSGRALFWVSDDPLLGVRERVLVASERSLPGVSGEALLGVLLRSEVGGSLVPWCPFLSPRDFAGRVVRAWLQALFGC